MLRTERVSRVRWVKQMKELELDKGLSKGGGGFPGRVTRNVRADDFGVWLGK